MKTFINVAQMKLASLKEGQFVETGGYYTKGDAGQAKYLIVAAQAADGYGDHTLANGTVAVLQVGSAIDIKQFGLGANFSGTADIINKAIIYCNANGIPTLDATNLGVISLSTTITPKDNVTMYASGTEFKATAEMTALITSLNDIKNWYVVDAILNANSQTNTGCIQHTLGHTRDCGYQGCEVKNTVGSWQIKIGYAILGGPSVNLVNQSYRVNLDGVIFGQHDTTTLEQLLIVNTKDCIFIGNSFNNNTTITFSALVFAYSENIKFINPSFTEFSNSAIAVQQSTNVRIIDPTFKTSAVTPNTLLTCINSHDVRMIGASCAIFTTPGTGPTMLALYNNAGTTFEGGDLDNLYYSTEDCYVQDSTSVKGIYSIIQAPYQKQIDKSFIFKRFGSMNNIINDCIGIPFIIGSYTILDSPNQPEGISDVILDANIINHASALSGTILVSGTSTSNVDRLKINCDYRASNLANSKGVVLDYIGDATISGNMDVSGDNAVLEMTANISSFKVDINANGNFITRANSLGNITGTELRNDDLLETMVMKNGQGATIGANKGVIQKTTNEGYVMSFTTTVADDRIIGVTTASSENNEYIRVVKKGRIHCLSNAAVAIGDILGASSTGGELTTQAVSTDSIALALETTGGSGLVDVLVGFNK